MVKGACLNSSAIGLAKTATCQFDPYTATSCHEAATKEDPPLRGVLKA